MDEVAFERFERLLAQGRKREAKVAMAAFITSLGEDSHEHRAWVEAYLERMWEARHDKAVVSNFPIGITIRHEIYRDLVLPLLIEAEATRPEWAYCWLFRTHQNLYRSRELHSLVGNRLQEDFASSWYRAAPQSNDARLAVLSCQLHLLWWAFHHWPEGILGQIGPDTNEPYRPVEECIDKAAELDRNGWFVDYIADCRRKLDEMRAKIAATKAASDISDPN